VHVEWFGDQGVKVTYETATGQVPARIQSSGPTSTYPSGEGHAGDQDGSGL
jgi:hypothetical protein